MDFSGHLSQKNYVVYGFGSTGKQIVEEMVRLGLKVRLILDKKPSDTEFNGIPILSPESAGVLDVCGGTICVVALHNHYIDLPHLFSQLEKFAFSEILTLVKFLKYHPQCFFEGYWLKSTEFIDPENFFKDKKLSSLSDKFSLDLLRDIISYRFTGEIESYPKPSTTDEYTPHDLPRYKDPLRLVDCGACTGAAVSRLIHHGYSIESLVAFEPDPSNFEKLCRTNLKVDQFNLVPAGVWKRNQELCFSGANNMSSAIQESGTARIMGVTLDSTLHNFRPNLIKFDVEGAEIEALMGAEQTIRRYRPNLCISIYHKPSHIYEIPELIASWSLNYSLYLRTHEHNTFGTVLYCLNDSLICN